MSDQLANAIKISQSNHVHQRLAKISNRAANDIKNLIEKDQDLPECRTISLIKKELLTEISHNSDSTRDSLRIKSAKQQQQNFIPFLEERDRLGYLITTNSSRNTKSVSIKKQNNTQKFQNQISIIQQSDFPSIDLNSWDLSQFKSTSGHTRQRT